MRTPDQGECRRRAAAEGIDAAAPWVLMRDFLVGGLPRIGAVRIDEMLDEGRFVGVDGRPFTASSLFAAQTFVYFHRDLPVEAPVPFPIGILYRDERILVADKPHFLSSIPRGSHVLESVVVRLRTQLEMPELSVAHRLDRVTSGVLLLTCARQWRRPYQEMFEHRAVRKTYRVVAPALDLPADGIEVASRIIKERGVLQAREIAGAEPNARTRIRMLARRSAVGCGGAGGGPDLGLYEAEPLTGRTHQIRLHFLRLGAPIVNDPFYPRVLDVALDDFSHPLQLQAHRMSFTDPVDGTQRVYTSRLPLAEWSATGDGGV